MFQVSLKKNTLAKPILDILAILGWGGLLLRYWIGGELKLLIHPNYFWLVFLTGLSLMGLGIIKIWFLIQEYPKKSVNKDNNLNHITVLPNYLGSSLLLVTALMGLLFQPSPLTSQMALQRGISENLPTTQLQTQSFRATLKPEQRSLIDWVRTINAYPEPDAYTGQKVKVSGFVVDLPSLPENYRLISRFILTCCAVDAYPVGLPVKMDQSNSVYPADTWLEIEGEMITETLPMAHQTVTIEIQAAEKNSTPKRQLVILAKSIKLIPTPTDPYGYY